jgi:hypothetical protein
MKKQLAAALSVFLFSIAIIVRSTAQTPPFKQCSPSGFNCNILITMDRTGALNIFTDPNLNYYPPNKIQGGSLIGFENDSRASVYSLSFNATPGDPTVAAFICNPPSPLVANAANLSIVNIPERPITPNSPPYYYYNICTAGVCPQPPYAYACDVVFSGASRKAAQPISAFRI